MKVVYEAALTPPHEGWVYLIVEEDAEAPFSADEIDAVFTTREAAEEYLDSIQFAIPDPDPQYVSPKFFEDLAKVGSADYPPFQFVTIPDDEPDVASAEIFVHRVYYWAGMPCEGNVSYAWPGENGVFYNGIDPERILDRVLGEGTRLKVTVEVIEDVPLPDECRISWHKGKQYNHHSDVITVGKEARS